jgi:transposase
MIQWKQTKLNRQKSHAEDLNNKSRTEINNLKEELRIERIRIHEKIKHENEINELARKLWQIMKDIGSEHISVRKMVNDSQQETDIYLYKKQAIDVSNNIFMKIDIKLNELVCQDIRFDISYVNEILNIIFNDVQNHNEHTLNEYKFNLPTTYRAMIIIMLFSM